MCGGQFRASGSMADYWKSTPKYWCKHCSTYVRDTKLDRANHEATGKHQNSIKRALRDLHRDHEKQERDRDRAKREVERLNGVVSGSGSRPPDGFRSGGVASGPPQQVVQAQRQQQLEQLADMGVSIPDQLRSNVAMAGEWAVTSTRVVRESDDEEKAPMPTEATKATGMRKRELEKTEEEQEEDDALNGLFKKPRRWGRDSKAMPEDDAELNALLSGSLVAATKKEAEEGARIKQEDDGAPVERNIASKSVERPDQRSEGPSSASEDGPAIPGQVAVKTEDGASLEPPSVCI